MNERIRSILCEQDVTRRIAGVRSLQCAALLMELTNQYNWDDGWEIPLMIVAHRQCDLGLALFLFWEFHEARMYFNNQWKSGPGDEYRLAFCQTLVEGLLKGRYKAGLNKYDTGFHGLHLEPEGSYGSLLRTIRTLKAREKYPDVFLRPVL